MLNKDKRSLILSMVLGDGCLHYLHKNNKGTYGSLTIDHGIQQADYVAWKANIISNIIGRDIKVRPGHNGKSVQISVSWNRLKAWRKFCYPNGKKDLTKILPFINHPEFAVAIWLMDDGYVEPSISKLATGEKKNYGARFRIFTESQPIADQQYFVNWFITHLNVTPMIKTYNCKKTKSKKPFLKFTQEDSLKIWSIIREQVLSLKSMQYKFRYIEQIYQSKILQRNPNTNSI